MKLNPWSDSTITDYGKLFKEFGIEKFKCPKEFSDFSLFSRGIVFGQRDFNVFYKAWKSGKQVSVLTGIMPSGPMHFGHKMVVDQCVYYQNKGIKTRVLIADIEAMLTRGIPAEKAKKIAVEEYLLNWVALGLDLDKTEVYAQSNYTTPYYRLAALSSGKATFAEMSAIYGDMTPGKMTSAMFQSADILHPQLPEYQGKHSVLVPVWPDQDPHIRFIRGIAYKFGMFKPSSTFHMFMSGIEGGKMSSSNPASYLGLNDTPAIAKKKIGKLFTGGRETLAKQKKLGGDPSVCVAYELFAYHFLKDDKDLAKQFKDCKAGKNVCGDCKKLLQDKIETFTKDLAKKREKNRSKVKKFAKELF